jgi:hypothetical protein
LFDEHSRNRNQSLFNTLPFIKKEGTLKKKAKEALQVKATEDAPMELDTELLASQQQPQELVQREKTQIADRHMNTI